MQNPQAFAQMLAHVGGKTLYMCSLIITAYGYVVSLYDDIPELYSGTSSTYCISFVLCILIILSCLT